MSNFRRFIRNARTKIICTIGPASSSIEIISKLIAKGMDVARLNFSHSTHEVHAQLIQNIRLASKELGKEVGILQDLQGPKIRIGKVENDSVWLQEQQEFVVTTQQLEVGNSKIVSVNYPNIIEDAQQSTKILIDDGYIILEVVSVSEDKIVTKVVKGGQLKSNKGFIIPMVKTSIPAITDKDIADLKFGLENGVDLVAMSFVRSARDIVELKTIMKLYGKILPVIAKIERAEAIENIDEIINESDGIMIARGDLGLEMDAEKVPVLQKEITRKCRLKGKPVIIATQMLESMIQNPRPTRAEASDVANAVFDGADSLMLSAETSVGNYPVEAVDYMNKIILEAESNQSFVEKQVGSEVDAPNYIYDAVARASCVLSEQIDADGIIALTKNGFTPINLAKYRPKSPIIALTDSVDVIRKLSYVWGVDGFIFQPSNNQNLNNEIVNFIQQSGIPKRVNKFVVTTCSTATSIDADNSIRILVCK
ncbi:MAG: pyruvate kinase [Ignavibacteria bacterium]|nr:pyruvate kinase [Ignavibacteria bacterium]